MSSELINYQIANLGNYNSKLERKITYIFSDYYGRGFPQIFDGPNSINLYKLDNMWYNAKNEDKYEQASLRGKFLKERFTELVTKNIGWGNHGSSAIDPDFFLTIPPIAGQIRGGDDSLPARVMGWLEEELKMISVITPWQVEHLITSTSIDYDNSLAELNKIILTIFFSPYWDIIATSWKKYSKKNKSLIAPAIAEELKDFSEIKLVFEKQRFLKDTIIAELKKLSLKQPKIHTYIENLDWLFFKNKVLEIFKLTLKLYENWGIIHKDYSEEISKYSTEKPDV